MRAAGCAPRRSARRRHSHDRFAMMTAFTLAAENYMLAVMLRRLGSVLFRP
jgi:hypothetical protein